MANGRKTAAALMTMAMAIPGVAEAQSGRPRIAVGLIDAVRLDERTIAAATAVVAEVFDEAGIDVEWRNGQMPEDSANGPTRHVLVTIQPAAFTARMALTRHAMGAAQGCAAESAVAAHIFYANVVGFAVERGGNIARVLGYAISHEIGHLLLPTCGHSTTGLMSAHWGTKELKEMAQGRMTFHDLQEAQIRTLLERSQLKAMR